MDLEKLKRSYERRIIELVNLEGVNLNIVSEYTHLENILQFICGLSLKYSKYLIQKLKIEFEGKLINRIDLISKKIMASSIYQNCIGFIQIKEKNSVELLDSTRIHPDG